MQDNRPILPLISYDTAISSPDYRLIDGTQVNLVLPKKGFGQKTNTVSTRVTSRQLRHVLWCQGLGDKTVNPEGSKIFPTDAEKSMKLKGTVEGQLAYPNDTSMVASLSGQAVFTFGERLSAQQLKGYISRPRAQLQTQLDNLLAKEAKDCAKAIEVAQIAAELRAFQEREPEKYLVSTLNTIEIKIRLKALRLKRTGTVAILSDRLVQYYIIHGLPVI
jgi:hypothetical protein